MQTEYPNNFKNKSTVELKLWSLENMGYYLWFDEKLNEWECFGGEDRDFSYKGKNKIEVIEESYRNLMQLK